jgi:hypothetical protein
LFIALLSRSGVFFAPSLARARLILGLGLDAGLCLCFP